MNDRHKKILVLALPIIGGMISQNVLNLVDTAMVGSLGDPALAAVGLGGFATFMSQALILGVSMGVQALASRRKGEGRHDETAVSLNGGLLIVLLLAIPFSIILYQVVPSLYPYLNDDPEVYSQGIPYLQVRVLAILFVGINFAFRGYWNAVDMTRLYMGTLIVMHLANIALNYALIFGNFGFPELGVKGAGIGTAASTAIGTVIYFALGLKYARAGGFLKRMPSMDEIKSVFRLSLPNGIQQFFFAAGFTAMYWIIGQVGTPELAASNVLINVMLVAILPGIGFGLAAATLVGQALGKGDADDAFLWGWDVAKIGCVSMFVIGIPMWVVPDLITQIFIHEPSTIALARDPMRLVGLGMPLEGLSLILMNALLGAGDAKRVMKVSIFSQWILFLPAAYVLGPVFGFGLLSIWIAQMAYRLILTVSFVAFWKGRAWSRIEI